MSAIEEAEQELLYEAAKLIDGAGPEEKTLAVEKARASLATVSLEHLQQQHEAAFRAGRCQEGWLKFLVVSEELTARGLPPAARRLPDGVFANEHSASRAAEVLFLTDLQWLALTYPRHKPAFKTWGRVFLKGNWCYWAARRRFGGCSTTKDIQYAKKALGLEKRMKNGCRTLREGSIEGFAWIKRAETVIGRELEADREASLKGKNAGRFAVADSAIVPRRQFFWLCKQSGVSNKDAVSFWCQMGGEPVSVAVVSVDVSRAAEKLEGRRGPTGWYARRKLNGV